VKTHPDQRHLSHGSISGGVDRGAQTRGEFDCRVHTLTGGPDDCAADDDAVSDASD
jgi:hypothetical protein